MRLIDADALMKLVTVLEVTQLNSLLSDVKCIIRDAPTIEERKHGHWFDPEDDDGRTAWHCSVCDYVVKTIGFYPNYNYCPCCGARMDKGVRK